MTVCRFVVRNLDNPGPVYERMMDIMCDITQLGLNHCDYNLGLIWRWSVQVRHLDNPGPVYERMMDIMCDITQLGLIHCDYNEFNVMLSEDRTVTVIDFPQMVSVSHANAQVCTAVRPCASTLAVPLMQDAAGADSLQ